MPQPSRKRVPGALLLAAALLAAGCRQEALTATEGGLLLGPSPVQLPAVPAGATSTAEVEVRNVGRAPLEAVLEAGVPFRVAPAQVRLQGGERVAVRVSLEAVAAGTVTGTLVARAGSARAQVEVRAQVLPGCEPAGPCTRMRPGPEGCQQEALPDDTPCEAGSACVEGAVCRGGLCVGQRRSCEDGNPCTRDVCSDAAGCLHEAAPPPQEAPCQVPVCSPEEGWTSVAAEDGTRCGPSDCGTSRVCLAGACVERPTPEGASCGEESPCGEAGQCSAGQCVGAGTRPLTVRWRYDAPARTLLHFLGVSGPDDALFWVELTYDVQEGGLSGGFLVSVTRDGQQRFRAPLSGVPRMGGTHLLDAGVVWSTHREGLLEGYSAESGRLLLSLPLEEQVPGSGRLHEPLLVGAPDGQVRVFLRREGASLGEGHATVLSVAVDGRFVRWRRVLGGAVVGQPVGEGFGTVAFVHTSASGEVRLRALDAWGELTLDSPLTAAPRAASQGLLLLEDGRLLHLGSGEVVQEWQTQAGLHPPVLLSPEGAVLAAQSLASDVRPARLQAPRLDGALRWSAEVGHAGSLPVALHALSERGTLVQTVRPCEEGLGLLTALDAQGATRFSCPLPYGTLHRQAALLRGQLVVAEFPPRGELVCPEEPWVVGAQAVVSYALPGVHPAPAGWSSHAGGPGRLHAERFPEGV